MARKTPYVRSIGMRTSSGKELFEVVKSEYRSRGRTFRTTSIPMTRKQLKKRRY